MKKSDFNGSWYYYDPDTGNTLFGRKGFEPIDEATLLRSLAAALDKVDKLRLAIADMREVLAGPGINEEESDGHQSAES